MLLGWEVEGVGADCEGIEAVSGEGEVEGARG